MSLLLQLRRRFWLAHSFFRSMNYNPVVVNPEHLFGKKMERAQGELEEVVFKHWNPINTEFESAMGNLDKIITKNMYFDFKIPSLKFSKDVTPRKTFEEIGFKWLVDKNFGIGCFKVTDNTMFDPEYSKVLYGLHGSGEILLAKHLFMNFANEPSKVLTTSDLVLMRDPREPHELSSEDREALNGERLLVRRIGALPGEDIVCMDNPENKIELGPNEVWVTTDNHQNARDAPDSRTFGPVDATEHVFGRVIYSIRSAVDHGPVRNPDPKSQSWDKMWVFDLDPEDFLKLYNK